MKFVKFGKYTGEPVDAVDLEELVKRLGDFFLQSGFESQFYGVSQMDPERSMEALRALKRRITDTIYRQLRADAARKHAGPGGQAGTTHQSSVTGFEPRTPALRKNHSRTRPNARTRSARTPPTIITTT